MSYTDKIILSTLSDIKLVINVSTYLYHTLIVLISLYFGRREDRFLNKHDYGTDKTRVAINILIYYYCNKSLHSGVLKLLYWTKITEGKLFGYGLAKLDNISKIKSAVRTTIICFRNKIWNTRITDLIIWCQQDKIIIYRMTEFLLFPKLTWLSIK